MVSNPIYRALRICGAVALLALAMTNCATGLGYIEAMPEPPPEAQTRLELWIHILAGAVTTLVLTGVPVLLIGAWHVAFGRRAD